MNMLELHCGADPERSADYSELFLQTDSRTVLWHAKTTRHTSFHFELLPCRHTFTPITTLTGTHLSNTQVNSHTQSTCDILTSTCYTLTHAWQPELLQTQTFSHMAFTHTRAAGFLTALTHDWLMSSVTHSGWCGFGFFQFLYECRFDFHHQALRGTFIEKEQHSTALI